MSENKISKELEDLKGKGDEANNKNSQKDLQSQGSKKHKRQQKFEKTQTITDKKNEEQQVEKPVSKINQCRAAVNKAMEHNIVEIVMTVCTFYALYADDIRILAFPKTSDETFYVITTVCLVLFLTEFLINTVCKPDYPLSFSFWMDLVSSVSLVFDIPPLSGALFQIQLDGDDAQGELLKAGKVSKITARAARLVRFIRLIRLMRVGKLYKNAFKVLNERVEKYMDEFKEEQDLEDDQPKLNDKIINKFDDTDHHHIHGKDKSKNGQGDTGSEKGKKKKGKKDTKEANKQDQSVSQANKPKNSVMQLQNLEYDERARKYAFGKSKSTLFINPDVIGMDSHSDDSEYGEKRKKNQGIIFDQQEDPNLKDNETKISKKLSDLTTKRVITLIFSVMISIPFFTRETYVEDPTSFECAIHLVYYASEYYNDGQPKEELLGYYKSFFESYHKETENNQERYPIVRVQYGFDEEWIKGEAYKDAELLRTSELKPYPIELKNVDSDELMGAFVSIRDDIVVNAALSLVRTTFLIVLLSGAAIFFTKDSNDLVLNPIERMLKKVKQIGANPLEAARMAEDEAVAEELYKTSLTKDELRQKQTEKNYETSILEITIIKIGALLALGFGEAGSEIIAKNMNREGAVDPMIDGVRIMAIFGFVAIRNFIDATEVLEEKVMIYANEIADIVHQVCDKYHGAANKNLGDCFLMVWKFKDDEFIRLNEDDEVQVKNLKVVKNYTDQAVVAFLKTMASSKRQSQENNNKMMYALIEEIKEKNQDFTMHLGFGLHMGWGIEGAIGSEYKIDASYLSPNVNLASRLEYATKQYGVPVLVSGQIYRLLSHKTQTYMRQVDRVTVKGSKQPMDLYTCDMNTSKLDLHVPIPKFNRNKKVARVVQRHKKQERYAQIMKNKYQVSEMFEKDKELIQMRSYYTTVFIDKFHTGLDLYLDGFWQEAKKVIEQAQIILQDSANQINAIEEEVIDGPCNTIINYMKNYNFKAPRTWKGYRSLTDK